MSCNNCGNCYSCLTEDEIFYIYNKVMNTSIYDRIKFGCNCFMCNDKTSASCIELSIIRRVGFYDSLVGFQVVSREINKIKKQIKENSRKLFRTYLLCACKLIKIYEKVLEKRYKPPYGKGYIEAKLNFERFIPT